VTEARSSSSPPPTLIFFLAKRIKKTSRLFEKNQTRQFLLSRALSNPKSSLLLILSPGPTGSLAKNLRTGREARSFVDPASVNSPLLMRSSSDASAGRAPTSSSRREGADGSVSGAAAALISRRVAPLADGEDVDRVTTFETKGAR
jgi:hypothetical protein